MLAIDQSDSNEGLETTVNFIGQLDLYVQPSNIGPAEKTGNGHEGKECSNDEKYKVVAGVDCGEPEEEGNAYIKTSCLRELQANGTGTFLRIIVNSSSLSRLSFSERQIIRCAPTGTATVLTSSGDT